MAPTKGPSASVTAYVLTSLINKQNKEQPINLNKCAVGSTGYLV